MNISPGDTPPHSMWEETQESQMRCSEMLVESMEASLPGYRVYPNIGNHGELNKTFFYFVLTVQGSGGVEDWAGDRGGVGWT